MKGHTEGENKIKSYLSGLDKYRDDPAVAEILVKVPRNLLLRARGLTEIEVRDLLDRVSAIASLHPSVDGIRMAKFESFAIALLTTARDRKIPAVSHYYEMLAMAKDDFWNGDRPAEILQSLVELLKQYAKYPAAAFRIWGQTIGSMPSLPSTPDHVSDWATVAVQFSGSLRRVDSVSAFSVWLEAVEWAKLPGTSPSVLAALVSEAYGLIRREPDPALSFNEYLWDFVLKADAARAAGENGLVGRIYSALAATEMVRAVLWTERPRLEELAQKIVDRGFGKPLPEGKLFVDNDAIESDPDLARDLEAFQAGAAVFLDQAQSWLEDDLVFTREWVQFANDLSEIESKARIIPRSLLRLRNRVLEMSEAARLRRAAAIQNELLIKAPDSDWVDIPLTPTGWHDVHDEPEIRSLVSLVALPNAPMYGKEFGVERVRRREVLFYNRLTLVEAQVTSDTSPRGILTFLVLPFAQVVHLDGTSGPLHRLNESFLTGMDDRERVLEYLNFFCNAVRGQEGPFRIVGSVEDIPFRVAPDDELRKKIEGLLPADGLQPTLDVDGDWRVRAMVNYGNQLYVSVFEVERSGTVEMLVDDPLIGDLNVHMTKILNGLRVPIDEEPDAGKKRP
jgi:hypothetical protein